MATKTLAPPPQWSLQQKRRVGFIALIVVEIALLIYIAVQLIQVEVVEDRR